MNKIFLSILVIALFVTACNRDCEYTETAGISATLPDTISLGQTVNVDLDYGVGGCGGTPRLIETVDGKHRKLEMEVDVTAPDCNCTLILNLRQYPYSFTPTEAGVYTFELHRPSASLLDTIIVN